MFKIYEFKINYWYSVPVSQITQSNVLLESIFGNDNIFYIGGGRFLVSVHDEKTMTAFVLTYFNEFTITFTGDTYADL